MSARREQHGDGAGGRGRPRAVSIGLYGALILLTQGSVIAPFIYTIF